MCTTVTKKSLAHLTLYNQPKKKNHAQNYYLSCRHGSSGQLAVAAASLATVQHQRRQQCSRKRGGSAVASAANQLANRPTNQPTDQPTNRLTNRPTN
jgi:hypothetical protein